MALLSCTSALHVTANVTEGAAYASLTCDAGSTRWAIHTGGYIEQNPVMGEAPSGVEIAGYFSAIGAGVFAINRAYSHGGHVAGDVWRIATNLVAIGLEQDAIRGNHDVGVPLCGL
jgi:hypothetical protein